MIICSAICQLSDASPFFKAVKRQLLFIDSKLTSTRDLKAIVDARTYPDNKKTTIIDALQRVVFVLQDVLRPRLVKEGYESIGQSLLDFDKAMRHCTASISEACYEHIRSKWPVLAKIFRKKGVLTEDGHS
jgi:ribosomal 50S subunit-associated protein YjgA (DUF615 family)